MQDMRAQAERFGAHLHIDDVDTFGLDGDVKTVRRPRTSGIPTP